jgi:hypothetical protein
MNHNDRDLFARDGHLTMLSIDRYDVGELGAPARHVVETHVEGCATCRARLRAVSAPTIVLHPRTAMGRSAGSVTIGYLAASAGVAAAASVLLGLFSVLWPDPQTARPMPGEPLHVSGSYTSVAQEFGEADAPALRVATRADELVVSGIDGAHLAVLAVSSPEDDGDTGGRDEPVVLEVIASMPTMGDSARVAIPARAHEQRLVVTACPVPLELAVGDALALDPGCISADVPGSSRAPTED